MLLSRGYKRKLINNNIERALLVPRPEAIKKVIRNKDTDRVVFSVMYHPALPSIPRIIANQERKLEVRRRLDTALVLTINDAS